MKHKVIPPTLVRVSGDQSSRKPLHWPHLVQSSTCHSQGLVLFPGSPSMTNPCSNPSSLTIPSAHFQKQKLSYQVCVNRPYFPAATDLESTHKPFRKTLSSHHTRRAPLTLCPPTGLPFVFHQMGSSVVFIALLGITHRRGGLEFEEY